MTKCPFCQYDNEDGALFCEQCKSDLGAVQPSAPAAVVSPPVADVPLAAVVEEAAAFAPSAVAEPVVMDAAPVADAAIPVAAPIVESAPAEISDPIPIASAVEAPPAPAAEPIQETPAAAAQPASPPLEGAALAADAQPRLLVKRGLKIGVEYPLYEGLNFVGRADEKPVDIDLEDQEPPDRIWSSRQHALITFEEGRLNIEDLNSSNGTFVNRQRIYPGTKKPLNVNDVIQIGTVQMQVKV